MKYNIRTYRKVKKKKCERCKSIKFLIVHHKDSNRLNNKLSNLETLCRSCHIKEHKIVKNFKNAYKRIPRNKYGRFGKNKPISIILCKNCFCITEKNNPKQKYCKYCKILLDTRHRGKKNV